MTDPAYEMCARCWHFIEPNDADSIQGLALSAYLHLDNGEIEHDHDAEPGGGRQSLSYWQASRPELFTRYQDGEIGPNSAYFPLRPEER